MARVKVKILKTCVLGAEGNEMNLLESQLPRFEWFCEVVNGGSKKAAKKEAPVEEVVETPTEEIEETVEEVVEIEAEVEAEVEVEITEEK